MTAISRPARRRSGPSTRWLTIGLFLLPALILYAVFVLLPVLQAMQYSLYKWNGLAPLTDFVGLQNYATAFGSKTFMTSVGNNLLIVVLSLAIQIPFSLALAVLLNRNFPGRALFRLLFFLPYVLSEAVTGIVFTLMLQPDSVLDLTLKNVWLSAFVSDWLGDSTLVMVTLFVIISWKYFGFHMIIMLAGLQGIPRELEEAAYIDGASWGRMFRSVLLPLVMPGLVATSVFSFITAWNEFIFAMTLLGGASENYTVAIGLKQFFGEHTNEWGYIMAASTIITIPVMIFFVIVQRRLSAGLVAGAVKG